jgi:hypothetical protein
MCPNLPRDSPWARSPSIASAPSPRSGKRDAARDLLAPVYAWFTEGFATRDLIDEGAARRAEITLGFLRPTVRINSSR